ncbi:MAG: hypothetical protein KDE03_15085 [Rhodobacteraceae bacterium]|nr:hypothetical protein [Paracoccaceae bacterium]
MFYKKLARKAAITAITTAALLGVGSASPVLASHSSKAQTIGNAFSYVIGGTAGGLLRANIVIYHCVGWEAGRYISIRKYGRAGDPGSCPSNLRKTN